MAGSFYRGTSINQDGRFTNKEKKLIQAKTWPEIFDQRIDLTKVSFFDNLPTKVDIKVMKQWVGKKITEILGFEDELVINLAISEVESCDEKGPNPKKIQLNLTGFLENKTPVFMKELWELLLDAQNSTNGIPVSFVDEKRNEIKDKMDALESQMSEIQNIENLILGITPASQRINNESNRLGDPTLTGFAKADAKTDGKLKEFDDFLKNYDSKEKNNDITDDKPPRNSDVRHKRDSDVGRSRDDRHKKSSHRDKDTDRYKDHRDRDRRDDR
jgi:serine/arginine repetitive matrix protein 1